MINNVVDEILINEPKKVSAANHKAPEFLESDYDENDLYQVENTSLEDTKSFLTDVSVHLNTKVHMILKT